MEIGKKISRRSPATIFISGLGMGPIIQKQQKRGEEKSIMVGKLNMGRVTELSLQDFFSTNLDLQYADKTDVPLIYSQFNDCILYIFEIYCC